ncbi:MAG: 3-dehydroquinate synthase [Xanthomonadales bacterium]|nr:3-dehydroquinate synthase [Xanthomonadales bacterium]
MPPETIVELSRELRVELGDRSYPILIGPGLLGQPDRWAPLLRGRQVLLVTDSNVAPHYLDSARAALCGKSLDVVILPAGEAQKSMANLDSLMQRLAGLGASRDACVVALGGGVIGDLSGFAAACWMRGVPFLQLPTTLLAMVDSSVGGKTAINLPQGKNLVGAFHQPLAVVADTDTLATLPDRELRSGLAEVIKYGAITDAAFLDWLDQHRDALLARDAAALTEAIERSCRHKADIVARDETERGERALLNFGHSFGHAIEAIAGYGEVLHGEAVAIGMCMAARLAARLEMASGDDAERLSSLLQAFGLPTQRPANLAPEKLLDAMRLDKKNLSGRLRLILWRGAGRAEMVDGVESADILRAIAAAGAA